LSLNNNYLNYQFSLKDRGYSNALGSISLPRHRWYYIKEAFSPRIVDRALTDSNCTPADIIVDPFSGSGTVPLQASLHGFHGLGFEVNPFLSFVSRTKLCQVSPSDILGSIPHVIAGARIGQPSLLETYSTFSRSGGANKWLFNEDVLRGFEGGWQACENMDEPLRDTMRLALLGASMDSCNAARDGKCLRYKKNWQSTGFNKAYFISSFEEHIAEICQDMSAAPIKDNHSTVEYGDCRSTLATSNWGKFKLCITSPPYLNSFDYTDIYRPELFLGKFIRHPNELMDLRLKTLRSHIQASWSLPTETSFGCLYAEALDKIVAKKELLWNQKIPLMIQAYFEDMNNILKILRTHARVDASLWIVVSTSAYAGVEIPVDLIIADIGVKAGWSLREVGVLRHLRTSSHHWSKWGGPDDEQPHLRESVVIFDASRGKQKRKKIY
jgi:DNA modification methylase